jgi:archaemetzincin
MSKATLRFLLTIVGGIALLAAVACFSAPPDKLPGSKYPEIKAKLTPLATALPKPGPGDWLNKHHEDGQTFEQYLAAKPVRRSDKLTTIYICLIGEFTPQQREVLTATEKYLSILYDAPVKERKSVALADIPPRGQRGEGDTHQILTTYVLGEVLGPDRPKDALAYLAFTASDLYPAESWNFVFGQATLDQRVGVWSIHRNGDPAESEEAYRLCLLRTMKIAGHETGHILTIQHCIAYHCGMNGCNNRGESDRAPLSFCPVCFRKLCWNLQVDPQTHLQKLARFCAEEKFTEEAASFERQAKALAKP